MQEICRGLGTQRDKSVLAVSKQAGVSKSVEIVSVSAGMAIVNKPAGISTENLLAGISEQMAVTMNCQVGYAIQVPRGPQSRWSTLCM